MLPTLVINLDRDREKWAKVQQRTPWPLTRLPAVDGSRAANRPFHMNPFMYGCLLSHRQAWAIAAQSNGPVLVLEDDCIIAPDFEQQWVTRSASLPADFDVAVLGYIASDVTGDAMLTAAAAPFLKRRVMHRISPDWWVPGVFAGLHCYVVSPQGGKKLLQNNDMYHADAVVCRDAALNLYCPPSSLATQEQRVGSMLYNEHLTWEWLLLEPAFALGPLTVRIGYLATAYAAAGAALALHGKQWSSVLAKSMLTVPAMHYFGTAAHIANAKAAAQNYAEPQLCTTPANDEDGLKTNKLGAANDALASATALAYSVLAWKQGRFEQRMDTLMLGYLAKSIVSAAVQLPDPTAGRCECRSLAKKSMMEYCGSLMPSGHMIPSLLLSRTLPRVGLPLAALQSGLVLTSNSHHTIDIAGTFVLLAVLSSFRRA